MEKIITVENLRKVYHHNIIHAFCCGHSPHNQADKNEVAVENVSFELTPGSIMGLLGPNGAGKTTTLKMITNLCLKTKGNIVIDGISLDDNPHMALSKVGAALDTPSFYGELSARENMEYFSCLHKDSSREQVMELLDSVGLSPQAEKKVKKFSLGMKQRLALARAMLGQPKLIILDEPANGLDPQGQISLYHFISKMAREKKTTFLVSSHQLHDMEEFCTDILILDKGKSILQGKTSEILCQKSDIADCTLEETENLEQKLSCLSGISIISHKGNQFTIKLETVTLDAFMRKLVESNLHIQYISMHRNSLQDLFLKLTGGTEECIP
ncbi:MAG: ABC transporter ATP-binding protein [Lachnospiraceae bacterium]|nr:ABC transporter ATP-binding protein [Lachnospiraceae bacterium]